MVGEGAEEGLVDGPADKLVCQRIEREHVKDRVWLPLDPEPISGVDVICDLVYLGFTWIDNDFVVVGKGHRADALSEGAGEEVIPRLVAVIFSRRIALEQLVKLVAGLPDVAYLLQAKGAVVAKPALPIGVEDGDGFW
jgi:hypothetical protein